MGVRDDIQRRMSEQDGVISRGQALALGATEGFIASRRKTGDWIRMTSGVYASSSSPRTWERRLRVALLAHERALVGGRSAAHLHGFDRVGQGKPEILIPYGGNNRSTISRVIRGRHFDKVATTEVRGFPCTSVAETILTLSLTEPAGLIERYVDDRLAASRLRIQDFDPILERLEFARQRGLRALRRIVAARAGDAYQPPTSELERLLYRLLDRPELPPYRRQVPFDYTGLRATVDAFIPAWDLIVEGDSRRWHTRQEDHDRDRLRDAEGLAAGYPVLRLTWSMLKYQPEDCLRRLLAIGRQRSSVSSGGSYTAPFTHT